MSISETITGTRLVFPCQGQVRAERFAVPAVAEGEVSVRSLLSLMSTGTENIILNGLYAAGSHWERLAKFPVYPGYSTIGVVTASRAEAFQPGDMVALRAPHASHNVLAPNPYFVPVPAGLDPRDTAWFGLAKIAFHGARAGGCALGSKVMVIGAGPIGQMVLRWAAAAGAAQITVIDPAADRLEMARRGGATHTVAEPIDAVVAAYAPGEKPEIVIDTTGNAQVFACALGIAADFGRVVVLGDTGFPGKQVLTSDVMRRGLTIVGAHDIHNNLTWNNHSISAHFFDLIQRARFPLSGLISHEFPGENAPDAYALVNARRAETMGVVFTWGEA